MRRLVIFSNRSKRAGDKASIFDVAPLRNNLEGRSLRGGALMLSSQIFLFLLNLGATMVLARLLIPQDFGLVAMVTAFTGVFYVLGDAGLATATIQRETVSHKEVSTLFVTNAGLGILLALLSVVLGRVLSWFYNEDRLLWMTVSLATGFLFESLSTQHRALIQRQMRFSSLLGCRVIATIFASVCAIAGAMLGLAYWSLVIRIIAERFAMMTALFIVVPWRPGVDLDFGYVKSMLRFGGYLTGSRLVVFLSRNLDSILLGRVWGSAILGLYKKAFDLLLLPISRINVPISSVVLPALSRLQGEPAAFRRFYIRALRLIVTFSSPSVVFCYVSATEIVQVILGEQWLSSIPIFRALGPAAFVGALDVASSWLLISLGDTRRQFRTTSIMGAGVLLSFAIGLPYGAMGVALGHSIATCLLRAPLFAYACRKTPITVSTIGHAVSIPVLGAILAGVITSIGMRIVPEHTAAIKRLMISAIWFGGVYSTMLFAPPWRKHFIDAYRLLRNQSVEKAT